MERRTFLAPVIVVVLVVGAATPAHAASPRWIQRVDAIVAGHPMSVMVGNDGDAWYRHDASTQRAPASNEKLLLSMALYDQLGPVHTFPLTALGAPIDPNGVVLGDLYLQGQGDPDVADARLDTLADALWTAGVRRVAGSVIGVTGPFRRDWWAPGWKSYFPADEVALPTALTFRSNQDGAGTHITDPESRAASYLTHSLRSLGVRIPGTPGAGELPSGLTELATVASPHLRALVRRMDRTSINFSAEVLGKALAFDVTGVGSISQAAASICAFEAAHGVTATCRDASGLSYGNRQTAAGIVRLLWAADKQPWAQVLRISLPTAGVGTLKGRLANVRIRAKTGTLDNVSALSGWVWSDRAHTWIEFSLLTSGMDEWTAKDLEDRVVHVLATGAKNPTP